MATLDTPRPPATTAPRPLLIDDVQDTFDARVAAHLIVDASPAVTYEAARHLDLLEVKTPLTTASFWVRDLPAKVLGRPSPPPPPRMSLTDESLPGWRVFGEHPGHEIVFGAIGVFWTPTISWKEDLEPADFATFDEPGWGKIACNFVTQPYGTHRTLLTYECRTATTDDRSAHLFARYWWLVRPFVGHVLGATVRTIGDRAEGTAA